MGKSSSEIPEAPDYSQSTTAQARVNRSAWQDALIANRPNQVNQYGSQEWTQDPNTGQWQQSNQLNERSQAIFDKQQANQNTLAGLQGSLMNGADFGGVDLSKNPWKVANPTDPADAYKMGSAVDYNAALGNMPKVGQYNQQATDLYNQLAQPGLDRQRAAKEAQMAAMGMSLGSGQAYNGQQALLNDSENRSGMMGAQAGISQGNTMYNQALAGRQQGANELTNRFNQGMGIHQQDMADKNNFFDQNMALHQNNNNEQIAQRQANMSMLSGLMGLGQAQGTPQYNSFGQTGAYQVPDQMGAQQAAYNANLQGASARNADSANNKSSALSTVGTVAGIAAAFGF